MKYKWLLFDLDGTLFNYDKGEKTAFRKSIENFGFEYKDEYLTLYDSINKNLWQKFEKGEIEVQKLKVQRFEILLDEIGFKISPSDFSKNYLKNLSECTYLLDGVENLLQDIYNKFNMMLITNGLTEVQRPRLQMSSIKKYFSDIVISEEVGIAKPDSKIFDVAFNKMGNPPKQDVLMIGDSLSSDIKGGHNYGIDTCWLNTKNSGANEIKPTFEIHRITQLKNIILG